MYKNSPYRFIPRELFNGYTQNGKIPIGDWWWDNSNHYNTPWTTQLINDHMYRFRPENVKDTEKEKYHKDFSPGSYGRISCAHLLEAFEKYNVNDKKVAVVGSGLPWIEAMLLHRNNKVTTIEYRKIQCDDDRIECKEYYKDIKNMRNEFDFIVTFSSIEHSGLGRYGDDLDPDGDIKTMNDIYDALKPEGLVICGFPVGKDLLMWNVHRVYGRLRLPLLFEKYNEIEWIGYDKETLLNAPLLDLRLTDAHCEGLFQPVIVLSKK